jgi:ABC-type amino acid transport substrate-binding protein
MLAASVGSQAATPKKLVIGVEDIPYYPYYMVEAGNYKGFARELFDAFGKAAGYEIEYRPLPVKRLFADLLSGSVDCKFPDSPFWQSDLKAGKTVVYSKSVVDYVDGTFVLSKNAGKGKASIKSLGIVMGFTPWAWIDDVNSGAVKTYENPSLLSLIDMVELGRIDAVYANVAIVKYYLAARKGGSSLVYDPKLPKVEDSYFLSSYSKPEAVAAFDRFMAGNAALVASLKKKYGLD